MQTFCVVWISKLQLPDYLVTCVLQGMIAKGAIELMFVQQYEIEIIQLQAQSCKKIKEITMNYCIDLYFAFIILKSVVSEGGVLPLYVKCA